MLVRGVFLMEFALSKKKSLVIFWILKLNWNEGVNRHIFQRPVSRAEIYINCYEGKQF